MGGYFFVDPNYEAEQANSQFRIRPEIYYGKEDDFKFRLRVRARIDLPSMGAMHRTNAMDRICNAGFTALYKVRFIAVQRSWQSHGALFCKGQCGQGVPAFAYRIE